MKKGRRRHRTGAAVVAMLILAGAVLAGFANTSMGYALRSRWIDCGEQIQLAEKTYASRQLEELSISQLAQQGITQNNALLLINTTTPLVADFTPQLVDYKGKGVYMDACMEQAFADLGASVKEHCGETLFVMSSYRTMEEQTVLYKEKGEATKPGASEHQAGLALDVYVTGFAGYGFLKSEAGQYVNEHCWRQGFIIRYPASKQKVTGIQHEPWHIRYVGLPHAEIMMKNKLCLEEYIESLAPGKFYTACGYLISRQEAGSIRVPKGLTQLQLSPDNTGHYIVTGKLA